MPYSAAKRTAKKAAKKKAPVSAFKKTAKAAKKLVNQAEEVLTASTDGMFPQLPSLGPKTREAIKAYKDAEALLEKEYPAKQRQKLTQVEAKAYNASRRLKDVFFKMCDQSFDHPEKIRLTDAEKRLSTAIVTVTAAKALNPERFKQLNADLVDKMLVATDAFSLEHLGVDRNSILGF